MYSMYAGNLYMAHMEVTDLQLVKIAKLYFVAVLFGPFGIWGRAFDLSLNSPAHAFAFMHMLR